MRTKASLQQSIREYHDDPEYVLEGLLYDLTEQVVEAMERSGVSRAQLAEKLGTNRAYITQFLRGKPNTTLRTLVRLAAALGIELQVRFADRDPAVGAARRGPNVKAPGTPHRLPVKPTRQRRSS